MRMKTVRVAFLLFMTSFAAAAPAAAKDSDAVTFVFSADVHACLVSGDHLSPGCEQEGKTDAALLRHIAALNGLEHQVWPRRIDGRDTGLSVAGKPIGKPRALVLGGDLTDDGGGQLKVPGEGRQLQQFASRYTEGKGPDKLHFPVYLGLGNHDLDQDGAEPNRDWYRREMRDYVEMNHRSTVFYKAPVPSEDYDVPSDCYSWDFGKVHLVQLQRFGGDASHDASSCLSWLQEDLKNFAGDGRPVIVFQHYGWDSFSTEAWDPSMKNFDDHGAGEPHWWSEAERSALLAVLKPYNVAGIFHGHEHDTPMVYNRDGVDLFKPVAAFKGGFALVRIDGKHFDMVLGAASDDKGGVTFTNAFSKRVDKRQ